MNTKLKKALIISGAVLGAAGIGFLTYRIVSRWNKTVVKQGTFTILVENPKPESNEPVKEFLEDEQLDYVEPQQWTSPDVSRETSVPDYQAELEAFEAQSGFGDY